MSELKRFYNNLDYDFDELLKSLDKASGCKAGSLDQIFKVDEFINMCRWFLEDALRAVDNMPEGYFKDYDQAVEFRKKLAKLVNLVNVPFTVLQRQRATIWNTLKTEVPELVELI